jgi:hypothetical protein
MKIIEIEEASNLLESLPNSVENLIDSVQIYLHEIDHANIDKLMNMMNRLLI